MKRPIPAAAETSTALHEQGCVVSAHRRHFLVALAPGETLRCVLLGRNTPLACGDQVRVTRVDGGGVIDALLPRTTLLYRSDAFREKLIAANVDQVVAVVAPDLALDLELVNRSAIAAAALGCRFVIAANKSDLPEFPSLSTRLAQLAALGNTVVPMSAKDDVGPLRPWLSSRHTVLIGQSGMGKSTLLNTIAPAAFARTQAISRALSSGRHTTTHSSLYPLSMDDGGGWIVDSPGMKAFGLAHLPPDAIIAAFAEFRPHLGGCRFRDCRHDQEPGCALRDAVDAGAAAPYRLALMRSLVAESQRALRGQR